MTDETKEIPDLHTLANSGGFGSAKTILRDKGLFTQTKKPANWKKLYTAATQELLKYMSTDELNAWERRARGEDEL